MAAPDGLSGVIENMNVRFDQEGLLFLAKSAGTEISASDLRNIKNWSGKGCVRGVNVFRGFLDLLGYEIVIRRQRGTMT